MSASPLGADAGTEEALSDAVSGVSDANDSGQWRIEEDFSDDLSAMLDPLSGHWELQDGRYVGSSTGDAVSALNLDQPLPTALELAVTINANGGSAEQFSNAFVVFDYQHATDFKFAGALVGNDGWVIGHRSNLGWEIDARTDAPIDALSDYDLRVALTEDARVALYVNDQAMVGHSFSDLLTDGRLGLATLNAESRFDDLVAHEMTKDDVATLGELPIHEDFNDEVADHLRPESGDWSLTLGRYVAVPELGGDAVSTLILADQVPTDLEIAVTMNADQDAADQFSNGFIIFDYQSPTDFKFAGAFLARDEWAIGHRTEEGWIYDVAMSQVLDAYTDHDLRLVIGNDEQVTLYSGEQSLVSMRYGESLTDGALGLGTYNSITRFDDLSVIDQTPTSNLKVTLQDHDLVVTGDAAGEVRVVATSKGTFEVLERGRLVGTVEGVTGDIQINLGDADDVVTLDLGDHGMKGSVMVDLGAGHDRLNIAGGTIGRHLSVHGGAGNDVIDFGQDARLRGHAKLKLGDGDDSLAFSGSSAGGLFVTGGAGDDSLVLAGQVSRGVFADTGDGADHVDVLPGASLGRIARFNLGDGDDWLTSDFRRCLLVRGGPGDDSISLFGETDGHQPPGLRAKDDDLSNEHSARRRWRNRA